MDGLIGIDGEEAMRHLVAHYGGLEMRVPKSVTGWVAGLPGDAGAKLVGYYGGDKVYIPKMEAALRAARDRRIIADYEAGRRVKDIARQSHLTERHIWNILGRPAPPDQPDLFGG